MDPVTAAAPAQPASPDPTITAADQAVVTNDMSAFRAARQAERLGTPLAPAPAVPLEESDEPADPAAPAPADGERKLSKRQQQINDYERRIAEQAAEIARLKAGTPPPAPSEPPAPRAETPAAPQETKAVTYPPELATYDAYLAAHPDAAYEDYTDARHDFRVEFRDKQRREQDVKTQAQRTVQERVTAYAARLSEARTADPEFDAKLSPAVGALRPIDALGPDEPVTALNDLAQQILQSPHAVALLRHFSDHPDDLARFKELPSHDRLLLEFGRLEASIERPAATTEAPPAAKPVTSAPPPPTTLGSKPAEPTDEIEAAVAGGDMARFKQVKLRQRMALQR